MSAQRKTQSSSDSVMAPPAPKWGKYGCKKHWNVSAALPNEY